ncbi:MAG: 2-hydroxyacid dehydrogenase [Chloroflexi bacterium]|nr:2-hydroxyacid dehydrogenase [Chloroflexota bacterium]
MASLRALITARFDQRYAKEMGGLVDAHYHPWDGDAGRLKPEELPTQLQGRQVLVTEIDRVDTALLDECPELKVIITCRGNPVNVEVPACTQRGVLVLNTPGRNAEGVADFAMALLLAAARHIVPAAHLLKEGGWNPRDRGSVYFRFQGTDLDDATVGLVGFGAVARAVARRLKGFGSRVLAYDPYVTPEDMAEQGVKAADLETVASEADFLSIHVHVTPETEGMIGAPLLSLMKPTAYLINTARAGAVDQEALLQALKDKRIAGAALDVFLEEPLPEDSPLRTLDNVVLTPHIAGSSPGQTRVQSQIVLGQLQALAQGNEPPHILNPEVASDVIAALTR